LVATRENSSRAPSAFWKLPGPGRPPAPCPRSGPILALTPRIVRPPPPTPIAYAGPAACDAVGGSETSDLLEPRSPAYESTVLLESESINRVFHLGKIIYRTGDPTTSPANPRDSLCGDETCSVSSKARGLPRGTAQSSRSRYTRARSEPGGGSEKSRGQIAAAADLPNDAAGESAARVDSLASPRRTRIRAIRKIQ